MSDSLQARENETSPAITSRDARTGEDGHKDFRKFLNRRNKMDGMRLISHIDNETINVAFFDPQYRGLLDKMGYGNEKTGKGKARAALPQMSDVTIQEYLREIYRSLTPSGYLFMWMDKMILINNASAWLDSSDFEIVDLLVWHKEGHLGMGYRTRRVSEYLMIAQKPPKFAKATWSNHSIRDIFAAPVDKSHPHAKPVDLQQTLIEAVSEKGDIVLDPCAGSFSVFTACQGCARQFIGADING